MMQHPTIQIESTDEQQEYYDHIEHLCHIIEDQVAAGNDVSVERIMPDILSGSAYLTNVQGCIEALRCTTEEPDEFVHLLDDSDNYQDVLQAMAYKSMEEDVREQLATKGLL